MRKRTYRVTYSNYHNVLVQATSMNGAVRVAGNTTGQHSSRIVKIALVRR